MSSFSTKLKDSEHVLAIVVASLVSIRPGKFIILEIFCELLLRLSRILRGDRVSRRIFLNARVILIRAVARYASPATYARKNSSGGSGRAGSYANGGGGREVRVMKQKLRAPTSYRLMQFACTPGPRPVRVSGASPTPPEYRRSSSRIKTIKSAAIKGGRKGNASGDRKHRKGERSRFKFGRNPLRIEREWKKYLVPSESARETRSTVNKTVQRTELPRAD